MAIKVGQAFERTSAQPIDASLTLTKAQMVTVNDNLMPPYYFTICQDDGKIYLYDKSATASASTGKFSEFSGGSDSSSPVYLSATLLDKDINDPTIVALSNLTKADDSTIHPILSEIVLGTTVIYDADGTMGVATAKSGTNVTITTATTSTPTRELTQAEYDALTEAEKKNGTIYFITDNYVGSTYVGAYDTIYSTTERVVGSYMGKPLYQKTVVDTMPTISVDGTVYYKTVDISSLNAEFAFVSAGAVHVAGTGQGEQWASLNDAWLKSTDTQPYFARALVINNCTEMQFGSNRTVFSEQPIHITLQYTKTTDTTSPVEYASPNDYSTSEKIVGTWIDGKPIYQKTVNCGTSIGVINHNIANIDKVVDASGVGFDATGGGYNIPFAGDNWIQCYGTRTRIDLQSKASGWNLSGGIYITLKYTKTS